MGNETLTMGKAPRLSAEIIDAIKAGRNTRNSRETGRQGDRPLMGGLRQKITLTERDPEYHYHLFIDDGARIQQALAAGYEPVLKDGKHWNDESPAEQNQWMTMKTGQTSTGEPEISYFMRIHKRFYHEDQALKQADVDFTDNAIKRGNFQGRDHVNKQDDETVYSTVSVENQFKR
jgi:hypothetical protein